MKFYTSYQGQFFKSELNTASCKIAEISSLQFPNSNALNHRIIDASFIEKGATQ
jgi:hypothetical protein